MATAVSMEQALSSASKVYIRLLKQGRPPQHRVGAASPLGGSVGQAAGGP